MAGSKCTRPSSQIAATFEEAVDVQASKGCASRSRLPVVSGARRQRSLQETAFDVDTLVKEESAKSQDDAQTDTVLYLAYGSNLCAETFRGKRGIKPLSEVNILAPNLLLTFDLPGIPYVEPCFANVLQKNHPKEEQVVPPQNEERQPLLGAEKHPSYRKEEWKKGLVGVVYEVTRKDYATIIATEGGGNSYQDILVDCYALTDTPTVPDTPNTPVFKAHTLCAPTSSAEKKGRSSSSSSSGIRLERPDPSYAQPSARYLNLLTTGADEHDLPSEYRAYLHRLRPFTITQIRQRVGRFVFIALWGPALMTVLAGHRVFADQNGRSPRWFAKVGEVLFTAVWTSYDVMFKRIFGDGERTATAETDRKLSEKHGALNDDRHLVET